MTTQMPDEAVEAVIMRLAYSGVTEQSVRAALEVAAPFIRAQARAAFAAELCERDSWVGPHGDFVVSADDIRAAVDREGKTS